MNTTLIIMAAGIGSRYGGGIKQLAAVDDYGHIIMDYSIHDAIEAGFNKIVFVIRRDIEADFREAIGDRIEAVCRELHVETAYAFQSLKDIPEGAVLPPERKKPWGTGQAVLAAKELIREPFAVINADDYYGKEAFGKLHAFLQGCTPDKAKDFCMAGFILKNTLSEHGGVTRGICQVDENGFLTDVRETPEIVKRTDPADGKVTAFAGERPLDPDSYVSMNMWGLTPEFMETLEEGFVEFFETAVKENPLKAEYLLPIFIGSLLRERKVSVKVLETRDKWFGVTYKEDHGAVVESFRKLIREGVYQADLFGDLRQAERSEKC